MRTLRLSLTGTVILTLLGGLSGAVVAQGDEGSGLTVTPFTGLEISEMGDSSEEEWSEESGVGRARTYKLREHVEWNDPRLPAEKLNAFNIDMYDIGELRNAAITGTTLLPANDGYWSGEAIIFCDAEADCHGMHVLTGHGAYEGPFAMFRGMPPEDPEGRGLWAYEGLIFEGQMPPMPEPVEPSAE
jgi:hypothetical protein